MTSETICKIVRQYNKVPILDEDMRKLVEIAEDYNKIKNYVYQRYSGICSLSKLYPGYTIQNEMTHSGLRERLGTPSVYFYLAIFDALGDIKSQWSATKAAVLRSVNRNEGLGDEEKHFLRYLLKVNLVLEAVLNHSSLELKGEMGLQYVRLAKTVDVHKLENYLRRQVRKYHAAPHTDCVNGFSITERAYRYRDHGIYIAVKQKRKRIFIPLTDGNSYTRQLYIRLFPEEKRVEILVPVDRKVKVHSDYGGRVGISMGMRTMIVTDQGHLYGEEFGMYQGKLSSWIREQAIVHSRNKEANPGRKKYYAKKQRLEEQLHSYINQELNRFLREEKPAVIYIPKFPKPEMVNRGKAINHYSSMWQRGYIRERLALKCREQSIELTDVFGKDISRECSSCGAMGIWKEKRFSCSSCGYEADGKENAARNVRKRGEGMEQPQGELEG